MRRSGNRFLQPDDVEHVVVDEPAAAVDQNGARRAGRHRRRRQHGAGKSLDNNTFLSHCYCPP
jgi:hypothetical protein